MQIAPIPRIRATPTIRPRQNDPLLGAVIDVESPFGVKQDSLSQSGGDMPGGQDDESSEQEGVTESVEETDSGSAVNLFA